MLYVFLACAASIAAWFVVYKVAATGDAREKSRARAETRDAVSRSVGLAIDGDPLGFYFMRGQVHGVDMTIEGKATVPLPGTSDEMRGATVFTVRWPLPDQIVCQKSDVDAVMGPLPSVPRREVGNPQFDARYAVFVGVAPVSEEPVGYRDAPAGVHPLAWADPTTLADMRAHDLVFMRARNGSCQIAFAPKRAEDIAPLVATAANVVRRASGQPLVVATPEPSFVAPLRSYASTVLLLLGGAGASFAIAVPLGFLAMYFGPLRQLNSEVACGKGGAILVSSSTSDGSTSYDIYCSNHPHDDWLGAHVASGFALSVALVFAACTVISLTRWPSLRD